MTFDDIKEMQIGSKKVKEAWLNGMQVYPSAKRIMDSLVCWYDIGKQQCTNESMAANPVLADLSGNGHDITCYNFAWAEESGISTTNYPNALVSDGVDDYAQVTGLPVLTKERGYTVIAKRKYISGALFSTLASKYVSTDVNGSFLFELKSDNAIDNITNVNSFGASTVVKYYVPNEVSYMTSSSYNNRVNLNQGGMKDGPNLSLFRLRSTGLNMAAALYSFLLFDRTLTTAEIEWVKKNMIESGGVENGLE